LATVVFGLGALVAAGAAVVDVGAGGGFAPVDPVVVAVRAPRLAGVGALAAAARGESVGRGDAADSAAAAVVRVLSRVGLAPVLPLAVAVLPPGVASVLARAQVALSRSVGRSNATGSAGATVVGVLGRVHFAAVAPLTVTVLVPWLACIHALAAGARRGRVRRANALGAARPAVVHILAGVDLASIAPAVVTVLVRRIAGKPTLAT
jgi:hypothetical protein